MAFWSDPCDHIYNEKALRDLNVYYVVPQLFTWLDLVCVSSKIIVSKQQIVVLQRRIWQDQNIEVILRGDQLGSLDSPRNTS